MITLPRLALIALLVVISSASIPTRGDLSTSVVAIKAARMFDGKSKGLVTNGVILVRGDKMSMSVRISPFPSGTQIIDLVTRRSRPLHGCAHPPHRRLHGNFNERRLKSLEINVSELALMAIPGARATVEAASQPCAISVAVSKAVTILWMSLCEM